MRLELGAILSLFMLAGFASGCSRETPAPRPFSVIFISVDTLRSDRVGAYGYKKADTPAIDQLAAEGVLFENAYCDVPWTTASMTSFMTGLYSTQHALQAPWLKLPESRQTMAEVFQENGYKTGAVIGIFSLDSAYGLDQGFDEYDDAFSLPAIVHPTRGDSETHIELEVTDDLQAYAKLVDEKVYNDAYKSDEAVTDSSLEWLEENQDEPFLLWAHYFGPHERLIFGEGATDNRDRIVAVYDLELAQADRAIGRLLAGIDDLGLRENTLVVLSSDHGQTLGERGAIGHGRDLYEPEVRIPLIARLPSRIEAGKTIPEIVRSVDLFPTFLDYAGLTTEENLAGRSVRALIEDEEMTDRAAFMDLHVVMPTVLDGEGDGHVLGGVHYQALRLDKWKYVEVSMSPPCWGGDGEIEWDMLGLDPRGITDSVLLPEDQCGKYGFTGLYDVSQKGPRLAREKKDMTADHPDLVLSMAKLLEDMAENKGEAESFDLTPEQERKLKSLGYLQ